MDGWCRKNERRSSRHRQAQSNDIENHQQRNRQHSSQYGKCNKHALVGKKSKHSAHLPWDKNRLLHLRQACWHDTPEKIQLTGADKHMASEKRLIRRRTAPRNGSGIARGLVHQAAFKPVACTSIHCRSNDVWWEAINSGPGCTAIRSIGRETRRFYRPVIFALQGPDDRGKRHASTQRFGTGLVDVGKQDREHGPTCSPWAGKDGRLGRHGRILAG